MALSASPPLPLQGGSDFVALCPQQVAVVATSTGLAQVNIARPLNGLMLELDVTSAATAVGDTLTVFVQTQMDSVPNWLDIVAFTAVLGNGGAVRFYVKLVANTTIATFNPSSALAAGSQRDLFGDAYRVRYVIVTSVTPIFTFNVWARPF